jgi:CheY-like chemotaxis protein
VKASLAAGADRHLSKPIRAHDLLQTMAELILSHGEQPALAEDRGDERAL